METATVRLSECGRNDTAPDSTTRWTVVVAKPNREQWAAQSLRRLGYRTYLPTHAISREHPVRHTAHVPLFRGYLFLALDPGQGWVAARYCAGVHKICMAGGHLGHPNYVRPGVLDALRAGDELRRCLPLPEDTWPPGTPCRLANGSPLDGIDAVVHRVDGDRAQVHVLMFGELREVVVQVECLATRRND